MVKKRWLYAALIMLNIPLGLATRRYGNYFPSLIRIYGGDVFAATCIFFGVRFLVTRSTLWKVALISYLVCIAIETSQLCQAPWMQKIRHTPPFGILLGYGFLWSDWICYAVGVMLAFVLAWLLERLFHLESEFK